MLGDEEVLHRDWTASEDVQGTGETWRVHRVVRGGVWGGTARDCRAAYRRWGGPMSVDNGIGFRLARSRFGILTI